MTLISVLSAFSSKVISILAQVNLTWSEAERRADRGNSYSPWFSLQSIFTAQVVLLAFLKAFYLNVPELLLELSKHFERFNVESYFLLADLLQQS